MQVKRELRLRGITLRIYRYYAIHMIMNDETVQDIIVDVCKRRITLISSEGETRFVKCEDTEQFMSVMDVIKEHADPEIITYVEPKLTTDSKAK